MFYLSDSKVRTLSNPTIAFVHRSFAVCNQTKVKCNRNSIATFCCISYEMRASNKDDRNRNNRKIHSQKYQRTNHLCISCLLVTSASKKKHLLSFILTGYGKFHAAIVVRFSHYLLFLCAADGLNCRKNQKSISFLH